MKLLRSAGSVAGSTRSRFMKFGIMLILPHAPRSTVSVLGRSRLTIADINSKRFLGSPGVKWENDDYPGANNKLCFRLGEGLRMRAP
jgi:hypothetical protein